MPNANDRQDPFLAFRFEIRLDNLPVAGFSECTGLQLETEVLGLPGGRAEQVCSEVPGTDQAKQHHSQARNRRSHRVGVV